MWYELYLNNLPKQFQNPTTRDSETQIVFGNLERQKASLKVLLPAQIAGVKCTIETEAVEGISPPLISKKSLKKAKFKLDTNTDESIFFGRRRQTETEND